MIDYMKEYRIGPDGKATFAIVQPKMNWPQSAWSSEQDGQARAV